MILYCPSCDFDVEINSAPSKINQNDGSDAWICLKCKEIICINCYYVHSRTKHKELTKEIKKK